jgi:hypothetical protein
LEGAGCGDLGLSGGAGDALFYGVSRSPVLEEVWYWTLLLGNGDTLIAVGFSNKFSVTLSTLQFCQLIHESWKAMFSLVESKWSFCLLKHEPPPQSLYGEHSEHENISKES